MTLTLIVGEMNAGKTAIATFLSFIEFLKGKTVYSNIHLNFPHNFINPDYALLLGKEQPDLTNTCFLFDELWAWLMDCRSSMSEQNKLMSYFFLQSSKDDGEIFLTSQNTGQNDNRIKNNFHRLYICERVLNINNKYYKFNSDKRFLEPEIQKLLSIRIQVFKKDMYNNIIKTGEFEPIPIKPFFTLYNTKEKIKGYSK